MDECPDTRWASVDGSLLYADLSGFTVLSERLAGLGKRGAEETNDLIDQVMNGMVADCDAAGGEILEFAGDAVIALFQGDHHTARAVRAASAVRATVTGRHRTASGVSAMLRVSSGVHSGEIILARTTPGCERVVVLGAAVTAVCAAQAAADAGTIVVSDDAAAHLDRRTLGDQLAFGHAVRRAPQKPDNDVAAHLLRRSGSPDHLADCLAPHQLELLSHAPGGEHRVVTVAFVEFSGVDAMLAAEGGDAVVGALDALSAEVARQAELHHVHLIDTSIAPNGGRYYLAAGAPTSTELDEEHMLRAVLAMLTHRGPLSLRAGVNRGRVFAGVIGGATRRTYTCLGDAVNLAARLCAKADAGTALVTRDVAEHVAVPVELDALPPMMVKGKSRPIDTAVLRAVGGRDRGGSPSAASATDVPLVGRHAELDHLAELARRAVDTGSGASVVLIGEPGIGKSRLLNELTVTTGLDRVWVDGDAYQSTTPYALARQLLRPLLGIAADATDQAAERRLRQLARRGTINAGLLPLAAQAIGVELPTTPEVAAVAPAFLGAVLHRQVLALLAATEPVARLIVVDDAHLADDASLDLLAALVDFVPSRPWLLCIGRRDAWDVAGAEVLALTPLTAAAAAELTTALVGGTLPAHDRRALTTRSGGNPLFLAELARNARETGSAADLPESVESLLMSRIDQLPVADRMLLRDAAVLGTRFDPTALAQVLDDPAVAAPGRWMPLRAFVLPDGDGLRFTHALGCQAAYEGLSYRRRRAVHAGVGRFLESLPASADSHAAAMALHFAAAGDHARGWRYGALAGDQARRVYANGDAAASYELALAQAAHVVELPAAEMAAVAEAFGDVCDLEGRFDDAATAYRRARRLAPAPRLTRKLGLILDHLGRYEQALRTQQRAIQESRQEGGTLAASERAFSLAACGGIRYRQGRYYDAIEYAMRSAVEAHAASDAQAMARANSLFELVSAQLGFVGRSVELFRSVGDLIGEADARNNRGMAAYFRGDWITALADYEAAASLFARTGDVVGAATATNNIGEILSDQGHYDPAAERYEAALGGFRDANYPIGVAAVVSNLARNAGRAGDHERARRLFAEALASFAAIDAGAIIVEQQVRLMEHALVAGDHDTAAALVPTVTELAREDKTDAHTKATIFRLLGWRALVDGELEHAGEHLARSAQEAVLADARYEAALTGLVLGAVEQRRTGASGDTTSSAWATLDQLAVVRVAGWPRRPAHL